MLPPTRPRKVNTIQGDTPCDPRQRGEPPPQADGQVCTPPSGVGWGRRAGQHLDRGSDLCYDRWGCETGPLFYGGSPVLRRFAGCSSVRLERTVRDREVGSSNLPTPTILPLFLLRRAIFPKIGPSPT